MILSSNNITLRFILAMIIGFISCEQPGQQQKAITTQEVLDFIRQYDNAWNAKDTTTIDKLLGEHYIYFTSKGGLTNRTETIKFLGDSGYIIIDTKRSEVEVLLTGNTATISSHWVGDLSWKGEPIHDNQRCGQVLIKQDGVIKLITEHCVEISQ